MIAVVDYHKGNLKSVERGLIAAGGDARITDDAGVIARAEAIVLPGVGAFADASATMRELGQMDVVRSAIDRGVPFLGICLGLHLMFEEGVEGAPQEDDEQSSHNAPGLAVLPGVVTRMPQVDPHATHYKVPHVGWNTVDAAGLGEQQGGWAVPTKRVSHEPKRPVDVSCEQDCLSDWALPAQPAGSYESCPLFAGIPSGTYFYFTHSYIAPDTPATVATTHHSVTFPSAVQFRDAAFGVQFHPEKSSDAGAAVLRNFVTIVKGA